MSEISLAVETGEATDLRNRLDVAEQQADRASRRVEELTGELAKRAAVPVPDRPRTRWGRLLRALGHTR